jgi:hypothetical protein
MKAVMLFSAAVHIAALGLLAAFALRRWMETRRPKEPSFQEFVALAGLFGLGMAVVATILAWPGRGFGPALVGGLLAGGLGAIAFLLCLGAMPQAAAHGGPPNRTARITGGVFVGTFLALELLAFLFLSAAVTTA